MSLSTVQEIERAISALTPNEPEELYNWLDQRSDTIDARIEPDLAAGCLDDAIERALSDEKSGRVKPL